MMNEGIKKRLLSMTEQTELEEYQSWVMEGISTHVQTKPTEVQQLWALSGLSAESGEVNELFEKALRKDIPLDLDLVLDECGDVLWYLTALLGVCGLRLDDVVEHNIMKLNERRYGKATT